jgi:hypothetical protein
MSDNNLLKLFCAEPVLTAEEVEEQQLFARADAELAKLPVDMPSPMKAITALLNALEHRS